MSTVRMKRGVKYADIFDSPEMIRSAQLEGWSIVEEPAVKVDTEPSEKTEDKPVKTASAKKPSRRK